MIVPSESPSHPATEFSFSNRSYCALLKTCQSLLVCLESSPLPRPKWPFRIGPHLPVGPYLGSSSPCSIDVLSSFLKPVKTGYDFQTIVGTKTCFTCIFPWWHSERPSPWYPCVYCMCPPGRGGEDSRHQTRGGLEGYGNGPSFRSAAGNHEHH